MILKNKLYLVSIMLSLSMVSSFTCANAMDVDMNCEHTESKITCLESFEEKAKGVMKEQQNFDLYDAKHYNNKSYREYIAAGGLSNISFSDAELRVGQKKAPELYKKLYNVGFKHDDENSTHPELKGKLLADTFEENRMDTCSDLLSQNIYLKIEHDENFKDNIEYKVAHCNIIHHYQENQKYSKASEYWDARYLWFKVNVIGNDDATDEEVAQYYDNNCKKYENNINLLQHEMYDIVKTDRNLLNRWSRCVSSYARGAVTMSLSPTPKEGVAIIVVTNEKAYGGGSLHYRLSLIDGMELDEEQTQKANKYIIENGILGVAEVLVVPHDYGTATAILSLSSPYGKEYSELFVVDVLPPKPPIPPESSIPPKPPSHLEVYGQDNDQVECFVNNYDIKSGTMTYILRNKIGLPMVIRDIDIDGKEVTVQSKLPAIGKMYMPKQLKVKLQGLPAFGETNISVDIHYDIDDGSRNGLGRQGSCKAGFKLIYDKPKEEEKSIIERFFNFLYSIIQSIFVN